MAILAIITAYACLAFMSIILMFVKGEDDVLRKGLVWPKHFFRITEKGY